MRGERDVLEGFCRDILKETMLIWLKQLGNDLKLLLFIFYNIEGPESILLKNKT